MKKFKTTLKTEGRNARYALLPKRFLDHAGIQPEDNEIIISIERYNSSIVASLKDFIRAGKVVEVALKELDKPMAGLIVWLDTHSFTISTIDKNLFTTIPYNKIIKVKEQISKSIK